MTESEFPAPRSGFVVTHFLVVSDQDRSREFYRSVFGATLVDYLVMMKRAEIRRYEDALASAAASEYPGVLAQDVSDWEMREYFEFF